ncbi:gamma carbonic anhydrase family protein [Tianweitania sp. BSSL-BM11]|uniref:Gamma carbonic anhydrase family protein n=1 Tax=Tianweitania aestuarii TaxID=2814886 RepID=A0ABS5RWI2_9HYPH|nr:gamma carbonic anhydrase family protein [Tianweitania aestuarii]MBS9720554.1 gamma carbonic anhydrase family protein [Tianweitania aestuarii]
MPIYQLDTTSPEINDTAWIADNAVVLGKVHLGSNVGIWFGAVLRGDNELITVGDGSNVQEHTMMHTDMGFPLTVGENCTIGHRAILHGCTIGNNSLVGMGAIVLNGAVIGENSLVGAGALVTEGKVFPPNSLIVGSPAKVVRQLSAEQIEGMRQGALNYQQNARRFASGLKETSLA